MSNKKSVTLANNNGESNVYILTRELENDLVLLSHPLAPEVFILKVKSELNHVIATSKSPYERCLEFIVKSRDYFDYERRAEIDCLCTNFVANRRFTDRLRNLVARLVGVPAKVQFQDSIKAAIDYVNKNKALFDDYHNRVYHNKTYQPFFSGQAYPDEARQRETIFNLAGFLLAQIQTK